MNRRCDARASFLPPYILERLLEAPDPEVRRLARASIEADTEARTMRSDLSGLPPRPELLRRLRQVLAVAGDEGRVDRAGRNARDDREAELGMLPGDLL